MPKWHSHIHAPVLIVLLAIALRLRGIDFGLPALNDPDELMFELGATKMLTEGSLNPGWFGHPATTTMYGLAIVNASTFVLGWLVGTYPGTAEFMSAIYNDPGIVILPGRVMIAVFGALCVWQTWRLAQHIANPDDRLMAATFAALILACSPVHIAYSQIIRSDIMGTFFMLLCLGAALRIARDGARRDYLWAAIWLALAVATKWPFALIALSVVGAAAVRIFDVRDNVKWHVLRLIEFGGLAFVALLLVSPYLVLEFETVVRNLSGEVRTQHLGSTSGGIVDNLWWYVRGALSNGLGIAGLALAVFGWILIIRNRSHALVILPFAIAQIILLTTSNLRWERWILPLLPLFAIAAGLGAAYLARMIGQRSRMATIGLVAGLSLIPVSLALTAWTESSIRMEDTRQQASNWADTNIPEGSTVLIEHFAFDLIDQPWTILFPLGDAGCVNAHDMIAGRINYSVIEKARAHRANVDYGTVPANRRDSCATDYAILTQIDRYETEQDRFPEEYSAYQDLLQEMDIKRVFRASQGETAGPVVMILERQPQGVLQP